MSNFGTNIKKIRSLKNQTQQELGDMLGLTRAAVSSYEEGRAEPKIETLIRASQIFGISVDNLVNKKLTVNELTNFKTPVLVPDKPPTSAAAPLFPENANWISAANAIIIDDNFSGEQILLATEDILLTDQAQLIVTAAATYLATRKQVREKEVVAGKYKIALEEISAILSIRGYYQPLNAAASDLKAEIAAIKKRLSALEKKL